MPFRCFISPTPTSLSADIVVHNPFFVACDHMLQERIVFFAFDELIADAHALRQMNFFQLMRYPNIEFLYEAWRFQMAMNTSNVYF